MPLQDRTASWNPIMGAVDMVANDVLRKREMLRNAAMNQAAQQAELQRSEKLAGYQGRIKSLNDIVTGKDFTPDTRKVAGQHLMQVISDPNYTPPQIDVQQQTVVLHPEVAQMFADVPGFDPAVQVTPDVAEYMTKAYFEKKRSEREKAKSDSDLNVALADVEAKKKKGDADILTAEAAMTRAKRPLAPRAAPKSRVPSMIKANMDMLESDNKTILDILKNGDNETRKQFGGDETLLKKFKSNQALIETYRKEYLKQLQGESGGAVNPEDIEEESELLSLFEALEEKINNLGGQN